MRTLPSRAAWHVGERRPRAHPAPTRAAALAIALLFALGGSGCALGFGGGSGDASVEVRNDADIGVNMYVLPRVGLREAFLGQVGPRTHRRIRIPRASPGDTVWLRARPIDGGPEYVRNDVVLGRESVWRIP